MAATAMLGLEELVGLAWHDRSVLLFRIDTARAYQRSESSPKLHVREAGPGDQRELLGFSRHFDQRELRRRIGAGHRCFIGRADGRIVFYGWIGVGSIHVPLLGKTLELPRDTAYFYNTFTDERFRDHSALPLFISAAREYCAANAYPRGLTLVDTRVGIPVRAYMKLVGATDVRLIHYRRRLLFKRYTEHDISPAEASRLVSRRLKRRRR